MAAEKNFETSNPKSNSKKSHSPKKTKFAPEHIVAYSKHEQICREWRLAARPSDLSHPAKIRTSLD